MKTIDFTKLPIGTKVWCYQRGWGTIVRKETGSYPVIVDFDNRWKNMEYSYNGFHLRTDQKQTLFLNEFEIPDKAYEKPRPDLKIDDRILVKDKDDGIWFHRHFAGWNFPSGVTTFHNGQTSWSQEDDGEQFTDSWEEWKLPE